VKLTPIHPDELEKFLRHVGCSFKRQKGSHKIYWRDDQIRPVVVPCHNPVPVFIIRNILRQLKISPDDYNSMLKEL
jgi:predicted RNA binding protein YcfA (HicA-like mRNA interferase family)